MLSIKQRTKLTEVIDVLIEQRDYWNQPEIDDPEDVMINLPDLFIEVVNDLTDVLDEE